MLLEQFNAPLALDLNTLSDGFWERGPLTTRSYAWNLKEWKEIRLTCVD
jgi:hypothetical protein